MAHLVSFEHALLSSATDELYISHHGNENNQIVVSNLMRDQCNNWVLSHSRTNDINMKMGTFKTTEITYTWKSVPHAVGVIAISKSDHLHSTPAVSQRFCT